MRRQRPLSREHLLQATRVHEDVFDRSIDVRFFASDASSNATPARHASSRPSVASDMYSPFRSSGSDSRPYPRVVGPERNASTSRFWLILRVRHAYESRRGSDVRFGHLADIIFATLIISASGSKADIPDTLTNVR